MSWFEACEMGDLSTVEVRISQGIAIEVAIAIDPLETKTTIIIDLREHSSLVLVQVGFIYQFKLTCSTTGD